VSTYPSWILSDVSTPAASLITHTSSTRFRPDAYQRIGIKTKIINISHHPTERFCERGGVTSVVFSEGSIARSPFSAGHLISYSPLEVVLLGWAHHSPRWDVKSFKAVCIAAKRANKRRRYSPRVPYTLPRISSLARASGPGEGQFPIGRLPGSVTDFHSAQAVKQRTRGSAVAIGLH
jgi:hypothetical protein